MPQPTRLQQHQNHGRGHAYGRKLVRPQPPVRTSGLDTAGMVQWAKDHKWHLLGGGLLLGAGLALLMKPGGVFGHDLDFGDY